MVGNKHGLCVGDASPKRDDHLQYGGARIMLATYGWVVQPDACGCCSPRPQVESAAQLSTSNANVANQQPTKTPRGCWVASLGADDGIPRGTPSACWWGPCRFPASVLASSEPMTGIEPAYQARACRHTSLPVRVSRLNWRDFHHPSATSCATSPALGSVVHERLP